MPIFITNDPDRVKQLIDEVSNSEHITQKIYLEAIDAATKFSNSGKGMFDNVPFRNMILGVVCGAAACRWMIENQGLTVDEALQKFIDTVKCEFK